MNHALLSLKQSGHVPPKPAGHNLIYSIAFEKEIIFQPQKVNCKEINNRWNTERGKHQFISTTLSKTERWGFEDLTSQHPRQAAHYCEKPPHLIIKFAMCILPNSSLLLFSYLLLVENKCINVLWSHSYNFQPHAKTKDCTDKDKVLNSRFIKKSVTKLFT